MPMVESADETGREDRRTPDWFALPDHAVLALEGRDAAAFAQAQLMNDVMAVEEGRWQWNGWLTPKGRVIALFALLRLAPDTVWLLVPDADPADIADLLRRFVFRSKLAIAVRTDLHVSGRFAAAPNDDGGSGEDDGPRDDRPRDHRRDGLLALPDGSRLLDLGGDGGPRSLRISTEAAPEASGAPAEWRRFDLAHGWPRLDATQREQWTPQQLSLDRLRAFSVKKGCYPGQEIVARTHFLGQAKRGLALVETDSPTQAGQALHAGDADDAAVVGSVVCAEGRLALAVLPLQTDAAGDAGGSQAGADQAPDTTRPAQGGASWRRLRMAGGLER